MKNSIFNENDLQILKEHKELSDLPSHLFFKKLSDLGFKNPWAAVISRICSRGSWQDVELYFISDNLAEIRLTEDHEGLYLIRLEDIVNSANDYRNLIKREISKVLYFLKPEALQAFIDSLNLEDTINETAYIWQNPNAQASPYTINQAIASAVAAMPTYSVSNTTSSISATIDKVNDQSKQIEDLQEQIHHLMHRLYELEQKEGR